ncbi:unnamed protein product [Euphydryas editha]|uniref:Uncharacterized protein n=1 Tax=Euphydryas editha TaxID=104508 RepID=A0AAU9TV38_EUPED|nr:unnamed protein product [Euphydryas editha]
MSTENYHVLNRAASPSSHKIPKIDVNDVEMVFGTPAEPKGRVQPDVHYITTEKNNGRDKGFYVTVESLPVWYGSGSYQ